MIKRKFFSMIELLVGIVVLSIMMAFLINAFTTAERIASTGNKSMSIFEKSTMALDFMSNDLSQLTVNKSPKTKLAFTYTTSSCSFTCRLPFSSTPVDRKRISYDFSSESLTRQIDSATAEELLKDLENFKIVFYDASGTAYATATDIYDYPSYCELTLKLKKLDSGNENTQRTFTRRVYFE